MTEQKCCMMHQNRTEIFFKLNCARKNHKCMLNTCKIYKKKKKKIWRTIYHEYQQNWACFIIGRDRGRGQKKKSTSQSVSQWWWWFQNVTIEERVVDIQSQFSSFLLPSIDLLWNAESVLLFRSPTKLIESQQFRILQTRRKF